MADLVNAFSWSVSAAEDFEECRRRRYWAKYGMWNGWKDTAPPLARTAYRLAKMQNRFSLLGDAAERGVMWALRERQAGREVTAESAYAAAVRPHLNECWRQSREGLWKKDPKKFCCLLEHYYGAVTPENQKDMVDYITGQARVCLANFIEKVLPALAGVKREDEVEIGRIGRGEPESFELAGIRIYAIPDYAYWQSGTLRIHDWKAGKPREKHAAQMTVYGLWANVKKGVEAGRVQVSLEYLASGVTESRTIAETDLEEAKAGIASSVADMAEYLVAGDVQRNEPMPKEEWELAADRDACRMCGFYELCKPELDVQ